MPNLSVSSLDERLAALAARLDQATAGLRAAIQEQTDAERVYDLARANAFLATTGTVAEREASVTKIVADDRHRAHLAEGMAKAALEEVRNIRELIGALRTVAATQRAQEWARPEGARHG